MQLDGFVDCGVRQEIQDRGEGLLFHDLGLGRHPHDGGFDKVLAKLRPPIAAHNDLASLLLDPVEGREHFLDRRRADQRAHEGGLAQWVADPHLVVTPDQPLGKLLGNFLLDDDPAG